MSLLTPSLGLKLEPGASPYTSETLTSLALLIDSDLNTPNASAWGTDYEYGLDLGSAYTVNVLEIYLSSDGYGYFGIDSTTWKLYTSTDNATWTHLEDFDPSSYVEAVGDLVKVTYTVVAPTSARYIKIVGPSGAPFYYGNLKITELIAYDISGGASGTIGFIESESDFTIEGEAWSPPVAYGTIDLEVSETGEGYINYMDGTLSLLDFDISGVAYMPITAVGELDLDLLATAGIIRKNVILQSTNHLQVLTKPTIEISISPALATGTIGLNFGIAAEAQVDVSVTGTIGLDIFEFAAEALPHVVCTGAIDLAFGLSASSVVSVGCEGSIDLDLLVAGNGALTADCVGSISIFDLVIAGEAYKTTRFDSYVLRYHTYSASEVNPDGEGTIEVELDLAAVA